MSDIQTELKQVERDRVSELLELIDQRIEVVVAARLGDLAQVINTQITMPFTENIEALWARVAEGEKDQDPDEYRAFIIEEAKRLGVRPGEVVSKVEKIEVDGE